MAQQNEQNKSSFMGLAIRGIIFYYAMSVMMKAGKKASVPPSSVVQKDGSMISLPTTLRPLFNPQELVDLWVYITEDQVFDPEEFDRDDSLVWFQDGIELGLYEIPERSFDHVYIPSPAVQNNGSVFAHVFFARTGTSPNPKDPEYRPSSSWSVTGHPLIKYQAPPKVHTRKNLLAAKEEVPPEPAEEVGVVAAVDEGKFIAYWKPNMTINLVDDYTRFQSNNIPPQVKPALILTEDGAGYYPTIFMNDFWLLYDKLVLVNDTVPALNLTITVAPISLMKWQMMCQMDQSLKTQMEMGALGGQREADEMKRVFLEGNPVLLGVTMVVSLLHTVFDMLAFKNDVTFWKKNKSMEGLSLRNIMMNAICQSIIVLYLFDNDTSWVVKLSAVVGTGIEFWKVTKACKVSVDTSGSIPRLRFENRESYVKSKTAEYDAQAMTYLSYVMFPCILAYSVYSVYYNEHKGWYSFVLTTLVGCVYTFGFIMMCPQLYINYRLKSVAHMPWRQMVYKFLNTIIDDLFAFVIKMPTLHRLSVFRDDVVFLVYLYQFYVYRVDMKRVNEFGFGGEEEDPSGGTEAVKEKGESSESASETVDTNLVKFSEKHEADIMERVAEIAKSSLQAAKASREQEAKASKKGSKKRTKTQ